MPSHFLGISLNDRIGAIRNFLQLAMLNLYVLNQNVRHLSEFDMTIRLSSSRIDLYS